MTSTEWLLLVAVIVAPLILAVIVTMWTLEQARLRSRKNRPKTQSLSLLEEDTVER